jgi:hypothetical protein
LAGSQVEVEEFEGGWVEGTTFEEKGDLVQLEAKGLGELPLVEVEAVEAVHTQFEGSCQVQEVRSAGTQFGGGLAGQLVRPFKNLIG